MITRGHRWSRSLVPFLLAGSPVLAAEDPLPAPWLFRAGVAVAGSGAREAAGAVAWQGGATRVFTGYRGLAASPAVEADLRLAAGSEGHLLSLGAGYAERRLIADHLYLGAGAGLWLHTRTPADGGRTTALRPGGKVLVGGWPGFADPRRFALEVVAQTEGTVDGLPLTDLGVQALFSF